MKHRGSMIAVRAAVATITILAAGAVTTTSFAQPPAGGAGGGRGQRGGQRGGQMTVVTVPASALAIGLKLTDDQKVKIDAAQKPYTTMMDDMRKAMAAGTPADPDMRTKMTDARKTAETAIMAVLTDDQKAALPAFMKKLGSLQRAGIQAGVYADLKLTADQETKLVDIADKSQAKMQAARDAGEQVDFRAMMTETRTAMDAVLTDDQKKAIADYAKAHPMQFGGGAGGGRRGGGAAGGGGGNL